MKINKAFAYLIHPGKGVAMPPEVSSKDLTLGDDSLSEMLAEIFQGDAGSRDFDITFNGADDGSQTNDCRTLMTTFQSEPTIEKGLDLATRLQSATDNRSGIGLLFLLSGSNGLKHRLVVSRFPTDKAILAEIQSGGLDVEFLEQVFIKRLSAYKALTLEDASLKVGFWKGSATDRQAGQSGEHISEYWLRDFLNADFSETPAAGTRRLAHALRSAIKQNTSLKVKGEIAAASSLVTTAFAGKTISISQFCDHFGLSEATKATIKHQLPKASLFDKTFMFDATEFKKSNPYRTVELDTGVTLTAPNDEFDKVFTTEDISGGEVEYKTRGRINDQRLARR